MGARLTGQRGRVSWASILGVVLLAGFLVAGLFVYSKFEWCQAESKRALTEFPAYGGAKIEDPDPNPAAYPETCSAVPISTTDDTEKILAYYQEQLTAHGWEVSPGHTETNESMTYRSLHGRRGRLCYSAGVEDYFSIPGSEKAIYVGIGPVDCR